ncbi:MAG: penicillin acylase family protein [Cyclobacteriaceae bacterium]|nr:penicillin acylase family protein [Cyclobacteriaceae bacterium]
MKVFKFGISLLITVALTYCLNRGWDFGTPIPPLGKFLDPFHGFWANAESRSVPDHELPIDGLRDKVSVVYDSLLIPHIFANNDDDLYRVMGYVTAQHRLWQMEFQTHAAAGRVSEIIGDKALDFDRNQRRLGMVYGAENATKAHMADSVIGRMNRAYTEGVNAYIAGLTYEGFPLEYKLLDYAPEPWTELKMGLLLKNMSKTLNIGEDDFQMTNALNLFGKEMLDILYPDQEGVGDPIVDNPGGWRFDAVKLDTVPLALPDQLVNIEPATQVVRGVGSNNWAVSGLKTANGSPILANDPHLSLSMPSIWFAAHMKSPNVNVMGVTFTGSPVIILGFNDSISWGATNAQRDLVDWYKIQFKDNSKNEYLSDGVWKKTNKVVEKFEIKNDEPFYDTVVYTHHGPVVYDDSFHGDSERKYYAFRWIAHDESLELKTFYLLNHARNHKDYMAALDYFSGPAQNFVFASTEGDIAMRIQGKYPVRRKDEGKFVLDGTNTSNEWQAYIPNDQNVMTKNPARGFVSSANQYPVDATYPYYVHSNVYEAYRNRRINNRLRQMEEITPQDMMTLQNDNYNIQAEESLLFMLSHLDSSSLTPEQERIRIELKNWGYINDAQSTAATYYEVWYNTLYRNIWDEMQNQNVALSLPSDFVTIHLMKTDSTLSYYDVQSTPEKEDLHQLINQAFKRSIEIVEQWKTENTNPPQWGYFKDTGIGHLLRLEPFSKKVVNGGNGNAINATTGSHGPSWRLIASMEKTGVKAWGVYPGGQSGNPGSPFYDNLVDPWANGRYFRLHFPHSEKETAGYRYFISTFNPTSR